MRKVEGELIVSNSRNKFYIAVGGEIVAQIEFVLDDRIVIAQTLVADHCRGKGLGKSLIDRVVLYARNEHKSVQAICPFAQMILGNEKKYRDVLI